MDLCGPARAAPAPSEMTVRLVIAAGIRRIPSCLLEQNLPGDPGVRSGKRVILQVDPRITNQLYWEGHKESGASCARVVWMKSDVTSEAVLSPPAPGEPDLPRGLEDINFMTCMTLVLLGNYAQTGHFGGPLAYTPLNVVAHLAGPELGGMRFDYRRPKHPYGDKFMLAGGHNVPTGYALWMIMGQALERRYKLTGDRRYFVDPMVAMLPIDALGFRRGAGAMKTLLSDYRLTDDPRFAQAKLRGIKALAGHAESTDVTKHVNGGALGVGRARAARKHC